MKRLRYEISGMSCAACVAHVERAVKGAVGSDCKFSVSLLTNSLSLIFSKDLGASEQREMEARLEAAIRAAGYRLILSSEQKKVLRSNKKPIAVWIVSAVLTLFLSYLSMGPMLSLPFPPFLSGVENAAPLSVLQLILALLVAAINFKFFRRGIGALLHLAPNMDTLIAIGSGASLIYGAVAVGMIVTANGNVELIHSWLHDLYLESAAMILTLVSLGKLLESRAKDRAAEAVHALSKLSPRTATVERDGKEQTVPVEELTVGDLVLVRAGELIPCDGEVVKGEGSCDESALTGESMPVDKTAGDRVFAACVLASGSILLRATQVGEDSSLARLTRLLEDAAASRAPIARIADRVSSIFVPCVLGISAITFALWMILSNDPEASFRASIAVLVISCPCALGLATPTAITVGIGRGAKNGILFRNAEALEKLCSVKTVLLDKTGTLTEGKPILSDLISHKIDPRELLSLAAAVERYSAHPLAQAVCRRAAKENLELLEATDFRESVGVGTFARVNGKSVRVGKPSAEFRARLESLAKQSPTSDECEIFSSFVALEELGKTAVLVELEGCAVGVLGFSDQIRDGSKDAVKALRNDGIACVMLTGDNAKTAAFVSNEVGLNDYRASLLPEDKEQSVRSFCELSPTAMVGDGINDAPALARADVGIAIGAGTEIAIDSADVVLSGDSLFGVVDAVRLSRATLRVIKQNLFWALIYNAVCIPVAAGLFYPLLGWQLSPMLASAAMSFSSVCVVTNALRLRRIPLHTPKSSAPQNACPVPQSNASCPCDGSLSESVQNKSCDQKGDPDMLFSKKSKPETYVIGVDGMMCPRCVAHVKNALSTVPGVLSVDVSLEAASATVTATSPRSDLVQAIIAAGYEVKES